MTAVINALAPSLGEKGTNTIKELKRQMVHVEEENIKLLKEVLKKIPHTGDKASLDRC